MNPDLAKLAKKYFNIELPCTEKDLKQAYRREAKLCHPDTHPGDGKAERHFKNISRVYKALNDNAKTIFIEEETLAPHTVDGYILSTLGLRGKDAPPCITCNGQGYSTIQVDPFVKCKLCRGQGAVINCPKCAGKGCPKCDNLGRLGVSIISGLAFHRSYGLCPTCFGTGGFKMTRPVFQHCRCADCAGTGEQKSGLGFRLPWFRRD